MPETLPLERRPLDVLFLIFFAVNLFFVTYVVDVEQIIIANPSHFEPPPWPPRAMVAMVHWWGRTFDPALMAREAWWRATIWIDALGFGPFYAFAIYAYARGRNWIRLPSVIWASVMMTNVVIILFEELKGTHASPRPGVVVAANLAWLAIPPLVIARMWRERPFVATPR